MALYFMSSPHEWNIQVLTNLSRQFINDFGMPRHLGLEFFPFLDAMPAPFSDQIRAMFGQVFQKSCSFHLFRVFPPGVGPRNIPLLQSDKPQKSLEIER